MNQTRDSLFPCRNFTFNDVHVEGSRMLAESCAENGVARFVQMSALNASEDSSSKFLRSKVKQAALCKLTRQLTRLEKIRLWVKRQFVKSFLMLPLFVPVLCGVMRIVS